MQWPSPLLGAYVFSNTLLLRISGIGEPYDPATGQGVVGRNYCYQSGGGVQVFMEDREFNPFMGAGALSVAIDDFNGDNFDHGGLGFFGGALVSAATTGGRPIQTRPLPPGTPRWGREWKAATAKWYNRSFSIGGSGASYPHKDNYLDLDPTYRDALGRPLIRMTYNYRDNDRRLSAYVTDVAAKIARTLNPTHIASAGARQGDFSVIPYQTTHNTGGAVMGTKGITVVAIHPGGTRTEKTTPDQEQRLAGSNSIGRVVDAADIAWLVTVLASPKSGAINGETIAAGGGVPKVINY